MFVRAKKSGAYQYLQLVRSERVDGHVRQQVIATLGRLDVLQDSGKIDALIASCARFAERSAVLEAHEHGHTEVAATIKVGPPLVFERLWKDLGIGGIPDGLLKDRQFQFPVERAVFLTVLHRLFDPGSDRASQCGMLNGECGDGLPHLFFPIHRSAFTIPTARLWGSVLGSTTRKSAVRPALTHCGFCRRTRD